jgi:hypothetical protein
MPKLPNFEQAIIPDAKLTVYLLNQSHPLGGPKAEFFRRFGFTIDNLSEFRDALLKHASDLDVHSRRSERHGEIYEIVGPLESPDGRNPTVLIAWMIRYGENQPRLITVVPSRGLRS